MTIFSLLCGQQMILPESIKHSEGTEELVVIMRIEWGKSNNCSYFHTPICILILERKNKRKPWHQVCLRTLRNDAQFYAFKHNQIGWLNLEVWTILKYLEFPLEEGPLKRLSLWTFPIAAGACYLCGLYFIPCLESSFWISLSFLRDVLESKNSKHSYWD